MISVLLIEVSYVVIQFHGNSQTITRVYEF